MTDLGMGLGTLVPAQVPRTPGVNGGLGCTGETWPCLRSLKADGRGEALRGSCLRCLIKVGQTMAQSGGGPFCVPSV